MMDYINGTKYEHILTIEDPIEFVHQSKKCLVNQREVHRDTHGFNEALRSALREDPDIILVGEFERGNDLPRSHFGGDGRSGLWLTAYHFAAKTIDRIIDVFPRRRKIWFDPCCLSRCRR